MEYQIYNSTPQSLTAHSADMLSAYYKMTLNNISGMNIEMQRSKIIEILKCLLISLLVIIGTFPGNDWSFGPGIDPPLIWVFNYLFNNGLSIGKHIIFPHGPLAFFMYPLQENILLSTLVTSILKTLLVFNIIWIFSGSKNQTKWIVSFIFAYLLSLISDFNLLILANILLLYCNFYDSNKIVYKLLGFLLTAFVFYIKAYAAIISGVLFFSFIIYYLYQTKSIKQLIVDCLSLSGFIIIFWILMYGTFNGLIGYIWGMFHLAIDNSSAVAYYPYNNWLILTLFLLLIITIFVINRTKQSIFFGTLIVLSFFAAWKYGMSREDKIHVGSFLVYIIICLAVFIVFHKKKVYVNFILSCAAVFMFSINANDAVKNSFLNFDLSRGINFIDFISEFKQLKYNATNNIESNISVNKLPKKIIDAISNSTVDVYPSDYSIIAANGLNWKPRVVLHSYASYTSWLDNKNAEHFKSKDSPEYLIIGKTKWSNINGGEYTSVDSRYFLNDEPQTILQILTHYDYYYSDQKILLLRKRAVPIEAKSKNITSTHSNWSNWIKVPEYGGLLLRAKLNFNKSLLQNIKSFLYKDEQFWIYLKLKDGPIHKYRIVPKNAVDGIWINPYIYDSDKAYTIEMIMFKCSNQNILTDKLTVDWEQIKFNDNPGRMKDFFHIKKLSPDSIIYSSMNDFEQPRLKSQLSDVSYSGLNSSIVKANSYSSTFLFPLDKIPFQNLKFTADCWVKSPDYKGAYTIFLFMTIVDKNGKIIWKGISGISIDGQLIDINQWNNIFRYLEYEHNKSNCILKAFIWNKDNKDILIDDFRVMIMNNDKP
jgi:hypothetical protein